MFAALAQGRSQIRHMPRGQDVQSTMRVLRGLGVSIEQDGDCTVVESNGVLQPPTVPLDCGNSGTTMRLMTGILAGQSFDSILVGDESLSRRPMRRVIEPLETMGARIDSQNGCAPLNIHGSSLHGIEYTLPVASAQVKSAVLLAGLFAEGETVVHENAKLGRSRDHTERMLTALGVPVSVEERVEGWTARMRGGGQIQPLDLTVPGDPSSAAFLVAAAGLSGGEITIRHVLANPSRTGFARQTERLGMNVSIGASSSAAGEPAGDLTASGRPERAPHLDRREVPELVDEVPLLVLLATQIQGRSEIRGVDELRVKETDRIAATAEVLNQLGANIGEVADGFIVEGPTRLHGATVASHGDHRIAMMLAVAGLIAEGETVIDDAGCAAISWPEFAETMRSLGASIDVA
jgi:3-phosphoshikimate 1-carboxyvinyltransferase